MNQLDAEVKIQSMLDASISSDDEKCVVLKSKTITKNWGWVVFYQSKTFVESKDFRDMLAGNAPYFVNKVTGKVEVSGTAYPIEHYINEYEKLIIKLL